MLNYFLILIQFYYIYSLFNFNNKLIFSENNQPETKTSQLVDEIRILIIDFLKDNIFSVLDMEEKQLNNSKSEEKQKELNEIMECRNSYQIFTNTDTNSEDYNISMFYIYLLYYDSYKSKNDISTYMNCLENQNIEVRKIPFSNEQRKKIRDKTTYLIIQLNEQNNKEINNFTYKDNEYLYGFCVLKGCTENVYKTLFLKLNENLKFFGNIEKDSIKLYDLKNKRKFNKIWLIPVVIIDLIILFNLLNYFLKKCFQISHQNKLIELIDCFEFNINYKTILEKDSNVDSSNLNLIKGFRGITLISIIIYCSFFYIYHLPTKVINEIYLENLLKNYIFPLIYHGARFGKKILYALSGFELTYKMLHYLDDSLKKKSESYRIMKIRKNISEDNIVNEEEDLVFEGEENNLKNKNVNDDLIKMNNLEIDRKKTLNDDDDEEEKEYLNQNYMNIYTKAEETFIQNNKEEHLNDLDDQNNNPSSLINDPKEDKNSFSLRKSYVNFYENNRLKLDKKDFFNWFIRQFYKYFLFVVIIIFYKYGTNYAFRDEENINPILILFYENISDKFSDIHILSNLFCFSPFSYKTYFWVDPFELVYNEITFFIIGSILIYVCYKYCKRLDIIILLTSLVLFCLKLILGIFIFIENGYYPAMFYQYDGTIQIRSYISSNQFMNLNIFLLGMFFGEILYCIFYEDSEDQNKKYLKIPQKFAEFFKNFFVNQSFIETIITHIILIFLFGSYLAIVFVFEILIKYYMDNKSNDNYYTFFADKTFNIVALFDSDIAIFILLLLIMMMFFNRDNIFSKFLEHKYWGILANPYWSNLLLLHICASYIFYYIPNRIKLDIYPPIFLSFQILILTSFVSCISFVLVEIPLKKITKLYLERKN